MGITLAVNLKHMDAKELRIGNWTLHKYLSYTKESESYFAPNKIQASDLVAMESFPDNFQPIPLTPEIFQKIKEANGEEFSFEWTKELGLYWDVWDGIYLEHIQYVHQFQNFYYMAENRELIVEL